MRRAWLLVLGACFDGSIPEGRPCSETNACPDGQQCVADVCRSEPTAEVSLLLASVVVRTGTQSKPVMLHDTTFAYEVGVSLDVTSVSVMLAAKSPADVGITVGGSPLASGSESAAMSIGLGDNPITITVRANDGSASQDYVLNVSRGGGIAQQAYLKASDIDADDQFGATVALDDNTLVVGTPFDDGAGDAVTNVGAVTVFVRNGAVWVPQQILRSPTGDPNDLFGTSVSVSGDTIVVGAPQEDSNATGVGGDASNNSADEAGAVFVFVRTGSTWALQAYLKASNTGSGDLFGASVSVDGNRIVVGAPNEDSSGAENDNSANNAGAAYAFTRTGTTWTQDAYLKASIPEALDEFGAAVSIDGDSIAVGAPYEDGAGTGTAGNPADNNAINAGAVYVFARSGATWPLQSYIKASNTDAGDLFGVSVDIDGNTLAVGADHERSLGTPTDNSEPEVGAVYIFQRVSTQWAQQQYLKPRRPQRLENFGFRVSLDGDTLVVSAFSEDGAATGVNGDEQSLGAENAGAAFLFVRRSTTWTQEAYIKAANPDPSDFFGFGVAISKNTLAIAANREDSADAGAPQNNAASSSGAVYLFQ